MEFFDFTNFDFSAFLDLYEQFKWFFSLGYVTVASVFITILLTEIIKETLLKKRLAGVDSNKKDKILAPIGLTISLVVFTLCHFANEMAVQGTFFIDFNVTTQSISLFTGASVTWAASKGIYTAIHQARLRAKAKKGKVNSKDVKKVAIDVSKTKDEVEKIIETAGNPIAPVVSSNKIGSVDKNLRVGKVTLSDIERKE